MTYKVYRQNNLPFFFLLSPIWTTFVSNKKKYDMVDFAHFNASGEYRRDELIRAIEHAVEQLTQGELEALYYDMLTKGLISE